MKTYVITLPGSYIEVRVTGIPTLEAYGTLCFRDTDGTLMLAYGSGAWLQIRVANQGKENSVMLELALVIFLLELYIVIALWIVSTLAKAISDKQCHLADYIC